MSRQYLAEGYTGSFPFIVDRSKPIIQENKSVNQTVWRIPGRFSECDKVNGNNRRYGRHVWEKNLKTDSTLQKLIAGNEAFGLLEHPKDGQVTLESPISHAVTKAEMLQDGTIVGEITIIDHGENSPGHKLKALVEFGYNPRVSSRGFGSLIRANDGVDDVQEDYVCEGWDVVIKPSFESAVLDPSASPALRAVLGKETPEQTTISTSEAKTVAQPVKEDLKTQTAGIPNPASAPSTAPAPSAAVPAQTQHRITESMNIQEIKTRIGTLKNAKVSDAHQFAEGVAQMAEIHQQIANYVAEDTKRSYEGAKLHKEVESIEQAWAETQAAPAKTNAKLTEQRNKILHVCKAIVETAKVYKHSLAEQLKTTAVQQKLIEELTTNGTGWMDLANKRKAQLEFIGKKYQVACEALMLIRQRYMDDMTTVGRHAVNLEFKEALAAKPELQKALLEAKMPQDILAVREQLEGKTEETPDSETPATTEPKAGTVPAPTQESKPAPAAAAPVVESKPSAAAPANAVIEETVRNPRSISEATEMVKRMSLATAK